MALYLGLDCSTQTFTAVVIDAARQCVVFRDSVAFDEPFVASNDGTTVHTAPAVWTKGLEQILRRVARGIDATDLRAISGAAQQHGSVYCGASLAVLTRETSPIWMDTSTAAECAEIERALGGAHAAAAVTGSRVFPRFTGPQIRKFAKTEPEAYRRTRMIHLVSSYLASLLVGAHAPLDHADASGMALLDLRSREWSAAALEATAPGLREKLPPLVPSQTPVGRLDSRWRELLGLPAASVIAWTGDNPSSLVGTGLIDETQLAISLGTSDTAFAPMTTPRVSLDGIGHVFASPFGAYMGITVFRNGSLAREQVRDEFGMTWEGFSDALRRTPAGNDGAMMLPWYDAEITPEVSAGAVLVGLDEQPGDRHVRAIVEGQVMAMYRHSAWMGVRPRSIHATGGASANREILQVIADVFDAPVYQFESPDSAALGAALRALQLDTHRPWHEVVPPFVTPVGAAVMPRPAHVETYRGLQPAYAALERSAIEKRG
jgi:xylulokinase